MVKYKSTTEVLKIIKNKEQIRNFGVIAHVDHGKTTMSDSLLANSGIHNLEKWRKLWNRIWSYSYGQEKDVNRRDKKL